MDEKELSSKLADDCQDYLSNVWEMYQAPFARFLGIEIESVEKDRVVCSMDIRPEHLNSMGRGHGGAIYSLIDHVFAIACNMIHPCTGQSTSTSYYRPASGKIMAVCVPVNRSRSLEVYEVKAYGENGKLIASSTCTAFVLKEPA